MVPGPAGASSIAVADRQELLGIQTSRDTAENQPRATSEVPMGIQETLLCPQQKVV